MPNVSSFGAQTDNAVVSGTVTDRQVIIPEVPPQGLMSVGPRVTPNFIKEPWSKLRSYNFFDVVKDTAGSSYIAIKPVVPTNTELTDEEFWFKWSDPDAQLNELQEIVKTYNERISQNASAITAEVARATAAEATKAPVNHASEETVYGIGNEVNYGHVKLATDDTPMTSDANAGIAATPKMVVDSHKTNAVVTYLKGSKKVTGTNWLPEGYSCQGMTTDGINLFLAFHSYDDTEIKLAKFNVANMQYIDSTATGTDGHFNSMDYTNGKIYASAGAGGYVGNYLKMAVLNGSTLKKEKIVDLPEEFWSIGVNASKVGDEIILDFIANNANDATFKVYEMGSANTLQPVTTVYPHVNPSVIDQDIHATNQYVAKLYSARNDYRVGNHIKFFGWAGTPEITAMLDIPNTEETEGIAIVGTTAYVSTFTGDIYAYDISDVWFNEYITNARFYNTPPMFTRFYNGYNGSEVFDAKHVLTEFKCAPCFDNKIMGTVIGSASCFNDTSASVTHYISAASHYIAVSFVKQFEGQICFYNLKYIGKFTEPRYTFTLTDAKCTVLNRSSNTTTYYKTLKEIEDNGYLNAGFYFNYLLSINTAWYNTITL